MDHLRASQRQGSTDDIIGAARMLSELRDHPGWDVLVRLVEAEYADKLNRLLRQEVEPYKTASFADMQGQLKALLYFRDAAEQYIALAERARVEIESRMAAEGSRD